MAKTIPIGSDDLMVYPFGNGSERIFENKILNTNFKNINLNVHSAAHLCRATLEGIAFAMIYGIEILKNDGVAIESLKVGNDNLFLSDVFSKTIADTLGISIQMLEATGADGAAKASNRVNYGGQINDEIQITKTIKPNPNNQDQSITAFEKWKKQLFNNII